MKNFDYVFCIFMAKLMANIRYSENMELIFEKEKTTQFYRVKIVVCNWQVTPAGVAVVSRSAAGESVSAIQTACCTTHAVLTTADSVVCFFFTLGQGFYRPSDPQYKKHYLTLLDYMLPKITFIQTVRNGMNILKMYITSALTSFILVLTLFLFSSDAFTNLQAARSSKPNKPTGTILLFIFCMIVTFLSARGTALELNGCICRKLRKRSFP